MSLVDALRWLTPERMSAAERAAKDAGNTAIAYAERFDSKQTELIETIRAQNLRHTVKTIRLSGNNPVEEPASNDYGAVSGVTVPAGTMWEILMVNYRYNYPPYLELNGMLFDCAPDVFAVSNGPGPTKQVSSLTAKGAIVPENQTLTLWGPIEDVKPMGCVIQVKEYSLEALYDAVG